MISSLTTKPLETALRTCAHYGVLPTRHFLVVSIPRQTTTLFQRQEGNWARLSFCSAGFQPAVSPASSRQPLGHGHACGLEIRDTAGWKPALPFARTQILRCAQGNFALRKIFRCSTSKFGIGEQAGSNRTPRGLHRVAQKIGGGWPVGVAFKSRQVVGFTWQGLPMAPIAHRILWLEGLEPGFNRGGNVDSFRRYIYIHGTGNETTLGRPDSHGCVHLAAADLLPLYDMLAEGTLVWMSV